MSTHEADIVPLPNATLVEASGVPTILEQIRPSWQARSLIQRVHRLLKVDPSSACQRIFNAAIHDLREKIDIAGLDIAQQAAAIHKLPQISKQDDLDEYPTSKVIQLAYRMGLLTRAEWRRIARCYEIRRDLEHEDDEYEAGVEDCVYIFKTCIEVVLSRDPVQAIRIKDVKELVNQPEVAEPSKELAEDYQHAPNARQEDICKFLLSTALDSEQVEIIRQNAYRFLSIFARHTQNQVKLNLVKFVQGKIGRNLLSRQMARVCIATGIFPYLRERQRVDFFDGFFAQMEKVSTNWRSHAEHGELLRNFRDCGGLVLCPISVRRKVISWMVLTYIGTTGGRTSFGNIRHVFYSNTAAPLIADMFKEAGGLISEDVQAAGKSKRVRHLCKHQHIARRFETLLDLLDGNNELDD